MLFFFFFFPGSLLFSTSIAYNLLYLSLDIVNEVLETKRSISRILLHEMHFWGKRNQTLEQKKKLWRNKKKKKKYAHPQEATFNYRGRNFSTKSTCYGSFMANLQPWKSFSEDVPWTDFIRTKWFNDTYQKPPSFLDRGLYSFLVPWYQSLEIYQFARNSFLQITSFLCQAHKSLVYIVQFEYSGKVDCIQLLGGLVTSQKSLQNYERVSSTAYLTIHIRGIFQWSDTFSASMQACCIIDSWAPQPTSVISLPSWITWILDV